jgi:glycosyltransferase involved in cell wall biosynthesis
LSSGSQRLLTIAIPTFNRASFLDLCLESICRQLPGHERDVQLLVSDNCSTDETENVVRRHQARGAPIVHVRNPENIGPDRNIVQCYHLATSQYVLVMGDDDVLLDGSLERILRALATGPYGVLYIDGYGFDEDHVREAPARAPTPRLLAYDDVAAFAERVSYYFTFVSGNVVNRSLLDGGIPVEEYYATNLAQTIVILSAAFGARRNAYLEGHVIAARNNKGAGYALCKVFGANFARVLAPFACRTGGRASISAIQRNLLLRFFPSLLYGVRTGSMKFLDEDAFAVLRPVFRKNPYFWLFTAPVAVLPRGLAYLWLQGTKVARRISDAVRSLRARAEVIPLPDGDPGRPAALAGSEPA